jgi:hypothetical protein
MAMIDTQRHARIKAEELRGSREKARADEIQRDRIERLMAALPAEVLEDPVRKHERAHAEQEAKFARERRAAQRQQQREQSGYLTSKTIDNSGMRAPDDLQVFIAPADWGYREDLVIEALCSVISKGDAEVMNIVSEAVFPTLERIADKLEREIKKISAKVDRRLSAMQKEVRAATRGERSGDVIDMPSLRFRKVN